MGDGVESIDTRRARRLALCLSGLLRADWSGFRDRGAGRGVRARAAAHALIERFGYLQLDTVSIAGARSHAIVLMSRIAGFDPTLAEQLLKPSEPLFEYWGHEASWLPMESYPYFAFRRERFREHPWWGNLVGKHPRLAQRIVDRIAAEGPLRSIDLESEPRDPKRGGWWNLGLAKRVATALWSSGELAIRERRHFHRTFDLAERVIPPAIRSRRVSADASYEHLCLRALDGHGFATTSTIAATFRLRNGDGSVTRALERLRERGQVVACRLEADERRGKPQQGWIRPQHAELAARLARVRPRRDRAVLLSPFDPLLWDRARVATLFDFDQVLEIYKPAPKRKYGYYCLPVLAGERLIARYDLKAERDCGRLCVRNELFGGHGEVGRPAVEDREAARAALGDFAARLQLAL